MSNNINHNNYNTDIYKMARMYSPLSLLLIANVAAIFSVAAFLAARQNSHSPTATPDNQPARKEQLTTQHLTLENELGVVKANDEVRTSFRIFNNSEITWNILRLNSSCRCTVPKLRNESIAPGTSIEIDAVYKAPQQTKDDTTRIQLRFIEEVAPKYDLEGLA